MYPLSGTGTNSPNQSFNPFGSLPPEILEPILQLLAPKERAAAAQVSLRCYQIITNIRNKEAEEITKYFKMLITNIDETLNNSSLTEKFRNVLSENFIISEPIINLKKTKKTMISSIKNMMVNILKEQPWEIFIKLRDMETSQPAPTSRFPTMKEFGILAQLYKNLAFKRRPENISHALRIAITDFLRIEGIEEAIEAVYKIPVPSIKIGALLEIATHLFMRGESKKAEEILEAAIKIAYTLADLEKTCFALWGIASILKIRNPEKVEEISNEATRLWIDYCKSKKSQQEQFMGNSSHTPSCVVGYVNVEN